MRNLLAYLTFAGAFLGAPADYDREMSESVLFCFEGDCGIGKPRRHGFDIYVALLAVIAND